MTPAELQIFFRDPHKLALLLSLIAGAVGAWLVYRSTVPPASKLWRAIMGALRFLAITAIIFMLSDPVLKAFFNQNIDQSIIILTDNSKSMKIVDKNFDRAALTKNFLSSKTVSELKSKYPAHIFTFAETLSQTEKPSFDGKATALGEALSTIADTAEDLAVGAVIVVTDGQSNLGVDPLSVSATLPFPVYTIGVGDPEPNADISVARIVANRFSYVGEKMPIIADIRSWRMNGQNVIVELLDDGKKIAEQKITLAASGQSLPVKFETTPDKEGKKFYTVRVPKLSTENVAANNSQSVAVKILPSRKKLLIACDIPSFEIGFLRRSLSTDSRLEISTFIAKGGGENPPFVTFPIDSAKLGAYDAIILFHASTMLTGATAEALGKYVNSGGSLMLVADDMPFSGAAIEVLNKFMPVRLEPRAKFVQSKFTPVPAPEGFSHPIMRAAKATENLADAIAKLPPLSGFIPSTAQNGASVLMRHPETGVPVLAVNNFGAGRCVVFTASPLWRWGFTPFGFGGDDHFYRKLADNIAQFLIAKEKIDRFTIDPSQQVFNSGEPISLSASLRDVSNLPVSGAQITLTVKTTGADEIELEMTELAEGVYEGKLPSLSPGKYTVAAHAKHNDGDLGTAFNSFVVDEYDLEFAQTNRDIELLRAMAELTGGAYFDITDTDSLLSRINLPKKSRTWSQEHELWNSWWLLILVVVSLGGEWALRKRQNLL